MVGINDESKDLLGAYPNVRRVLVSAQTFTLEEIHNAIINWIEDLRNEGDIASLARLKYATMNPDTAKATLLKLVRVAIGQCYNRRTTNEAMTSIVWPISFTQDLLGLLVAIDYDISPVEESLPPSPIVKEPKLALGEVVWNVCRASGRNPVWFCQFKDTREFFDLDKQTQKEFNEMALEIETGFDNIIGFDNYEF